MLCYNSSVVNISLQVIIIRWRIKSRILMCASIPIDTNQKKKEIQEVGFSVRILIYVIFFLSWWHWLGQRMTTTSIHKRKMYNDSAPKIYYRRLGYVLYSLSCCGVNCHHWITDPFLSTNDFFFHFYFLFFFKFCCFPFFIIG